MNRTEFIILSILKKKEAADRLSAMTIQELIQTDELPYQVNTIYKKVAAFVSDGYAARGIRDGHADTFYITAAGSRALDQEKCSG